MLSNWFAFTELALLQSAVKQLTTLQNARVIKIMFTFIK